MPQSERVDQNQLTESFVKPTSVGSARSIRPSLNAYSPSRFLLVLLAFGLSAISGCAGTGAEQGLATGTSAMAPSLTVQWLPPCSIKVAEPYFAVDVFADGGVRYMGGTQTREAGERRTHISSREARKLISEANRFVTRDTGPLINHSKSSTLDQSYCLEVRVQSGGTTRTKRARSDVWQSKALIEALDQTVHQKEWVCPARYGVPAPMEQRLGYSYCTESPIARLTFADHTVCPSGHNVDIFADGTVRYFGNQISVAAHGTSRRDDVLNQEYHTLSRGDFDRFIALVSSFELVPDPVCTGILQNEDCSENNPKRLFRSNDEAVAEDLIQFLNQTMRINWATLSSQPERCPSSEPFKSSFFIEAGYVSRTHSRSR